MMENTIILVVDDNEDICEVLYDWLGEECGFKVLMAHSGNDALKLLQENHVDHVVTDVKMPNGTGYDLLLGINKLGLKLKTIMVMTGYSDIKEEEFRRNGANFFFNKPLDLFEISRILEERSGKAAA